MGGGLGALMGLNTQNNNNDLDDLTKMEMEMMNAENENGAEANMIQIRMFIDMDEDDGNALNIDTNELFKRDDMTLQYYVDVSNFSVTIF